MIALNHTISEKLPSEIINPIPNPLPFTLPSSLTILRRCTFHLSDPSQNARLNALGAAYDIMALRPIDEKSLGLACQSLECDIISLDPSTRHRFYFRQKMLSSAQQRGIKLEICYAPGILAIDSQARRNLISNATQLIRATKGRGLVISSEAKRALSLRSPWDVVNLACMWGLGQERGVEAIGREARSAVMQSGLKRTGYRGVIDVVYGGERPPLAEKPTKDKNAADAGKGKRKAVILDEGVEEAPEKPISKTQLKKRAKKAREEAARLENGTKGELGLQAADTGTDAQAAKPDTDGT